jgi:hypothetical protein
MNTKLLNLPRSTLGEVARNPHVGKPGVKPTPPGAVGISPNVRVEASKLNPELQRKLADVVAGKRVNY